MEWCTFQSEFQSQFITRIFFLTSKEARDVQTTDFARQRRRRRRRYMVAFGDPLCPKTLFQFILVFRSPTERTVSHFLPSPRKGPPTIFSEGEWSPLDEQPWVVMALQPIPTLANNSRNIFVTKYLIKLLNFFNRRTSISTLSCYSVLFVYCYVSNSFVF